jgi:hypothetical protein
MSERQLQDMAVLSVHLSAHHAHLRHALVAASRPAKNPKNIWRILMSKKKIVIPGLVTMVTALAIVIGVVVQTQAPVSAAELTQRSLNKISSLSDNEEKGLNTRINGNAEDELQAAQKAKDLTVLSYDEFIATADGRNLPPPPPGVSDTPDFKGLHYLVYTSSDGVKHIIGVDKDNLPVIVMGMSEVNGDRQGNVFHEKGAGEKDAGPVGGSVQCTRANGTEPVCTTSGGGTPPTCVTMPSGATSCSSGPEKQE